MIELQEFKQKHKAGWVWACLGWYGSVKHEVSWLTLRLSAALPSFEIAYPNILRACRRKSTYMQDMTNTYNHLTLNTNTMPISCHHIVNISLLCLIPFHPRYFNVLFIEVPSGISHICYSPFASTNADVGCYTSKLSANARMCNPLWAIQCQDPQRSGRLAPSNFSAKSTRHTISKYKNSKNFCTRNDDVKIPKWHIVLYGKKNDDPLSCAPLHSCGISAGG